MIGKNNKGSIGPLMGAEPQDKSIYIKVPFRDGPDEPRIHELWRITVATQASFLSLMRF
jgi:hypothetical protein